MDKRRAEWLKMHNLYRKSEIRKAIWTIERKGAKKLDEMPGNWRISREKRNSLDLQEFPIKIEQFPVKKREKTAKNWRKIAVLVCFKRKTTTKNRYLRRPKTKNQRKIEFRRPKTSKNRKLRLKIRPRVRFIDRKLIRRRECLVDPQNLISWIRRQEKAENLRIFQEKRTILGGKCAKNWLGNSNF